MEYTNDDSVKYEKWGIKKWKLKLREKQNVPKDHKRKNLMQ